MKKFLHLYSPRGASAIMRKSVSQRDVAAVEMTPGGHEKPLEACKDQESVPPGSSRVRPHPHPLELPAHEALHRRVDMFPGYPGFPQKVKLALETASQRWQPPGSSPELGLSSFSCRDKAQAGKLEESGRLPSVSKNGVRSRRAFISRLPCASTGFLHTHPATS